LAKMARASSVKRGAMITSVKISLIRLARSSPSVWLTMMMPPNGACRSVAYALSQAATSVSALPTPQGFVCFRMATVGRSNSPIR